MATRKILVDLDFNAAGRVVGLLDPSAAQTWAPVPTPGQTQGTDAPGVRISPRTKERFPEEITIILQHQFWDLSVSDQGFEVGLSFQNIPEKLYVPWETIRGFFDPSVEFGLKFQVEDGEPETGANDTEPSAAPTPAPAPARLTPKAPRGAGSEPTEAPAKGKSKTPAPAASDKNEAPPSGDAKVVSIDAFRKKH